MADGLLRRSISSLLLVTVAAGSVPLAFAQTDEERAGARAAADAGLKAYEAKKWSDCVDYFSRAESLVHAPPHLLYLARCSVQTGRLVRAREAYLKITKEVIAADKPKAFHDAKKDAEKELAALEPRLATLNVKVNGANGKSVTVTMDGQAIPPALVGIPRPVDPGEHKFQATADGMASKVETITVKEGQSDSVTLELVAGGQVASTTVPEPKKPEPAATTTASAEPTAAPSVTTAPTTSPTTTPDTGGGSGLRTVGFVTIGVGVVGLVAGGVFFAQSGSKKSDADAVFNDNNCAVNGCPDHQAEIKDLDDKSKSAKTLAFVAGGLGVVALGVGITLVIVGGGKSDSKSANALTVQPTIGLGTFGLRGNF
jgi:hypothetical protein